MNICRVALCLMLTATLAGTGWAQSPSPSGAPPAHNQRPAMLGRIKSQLGLTDAQIAQLAPILKSYREKERQQMQAQRSQLESILTPEQLQQMEQWKQSHGGGRQGGPRGNSSGAPAGGPQGRRQPGGDASTGGPQGRRQGGGGPLAQLNLTDAQKASLRELRRQHQQQVMADRQALFAQTKAILTADQESKLEQMMSRRRGPGAQGQNGPGGQNRRPPGANGQGPGPNGQGPNGPPENDDQ